MDIIGLQERMLGHRSHCPLLLNDYIARCIFEVDKVYFSLTDFKSVLPQIKAAIEDSAFVSFDTEFTGLNIKDAPSVGPYDTALEAYEKLRQSANFSVIQFGLCTFHENPENGRLLIWLIF